MPLSWVLVLWPCIGAVALALIPPRRGLALLANVAVSAVSLALALALLGQPHGEHGWTRTDALNLPFVVVSALIGLTTAAFSAATIAAERLDGRRSRAWHAAFQVFMGGLFLALLADNPGLLWVGIEVATLASVLMVGAGSAPAAWRMLILCGVGLALALFGTILLHLAAQSGDGDAGLLSLGFVLLLVGYGTIAGLVPLHAWLPDAEAAGPLPVAALLSCLLPNAALLAILRAGTVVGASPDALPPGPFLVGFGLLSLTLAAVSLWHHRDARRLFAWSSIGHIGLATIAFGLGGAVASLAGLLHLLGHALVKGAVVFAVGAATQIKGSRAIGDIPGLAASHPPLGWGLALGIAALAGLLPSALFVSELRLVGEAAARTPWLIAPVGAGLLVTAAALVRATGALCLGAPTRDNPVPGAFALPGGILWATVPVWLHLALAVALGFALPPALVALLREAAGSLR